MPKILYITARSDYGGGPEQVHLLIKRLSAVFKVYVACPNDVPYYATFGKYAECVEIPHRKFSISRLLFLYKTVREKGIDIIHSHGKGAGIYSRLLGALTRKPVVHTFQGFHIWHLNPLHKFFYLCCERALAKVTDVFINVSESERSTCLNANFYSKKKFTVVPIGVEVPALRRRRPGSGTFALINVSRLSYEKGVDILFDVVRVIVSTERNFKLFLAGDGPDRKNLEKSAKALGIERSVVFLGSISEAAKQQLLESADIFITASRGEGMPIALLEAMARSLPVVATDVVGNRDVVIHGKNGFLFDINSPEEGAKRVLDLMKNQAMYEEMSKNAYLTMTEKFSVESMCERTKEVYLSLLGAGKRKGAVRGEVYSDKAVAVNAINTE